MYQPQFKYTDKLVTELVRLENYKTTLQDIDLSQDSKFKMNLSTKIYDMFHLAHILGVEITLKDAEKLSTGMTIESIDPIKLQILINFKHLIDFTQSNASESYSEIDLSIVNHIHKMIVSDWKENWEARFRNISDEIDTTTDNWSELRDKDIDSARLEQEVIEVIQWYRDVTPTVTPIIRIGVFIYRIIELYPFIAGNKVTIIALANYLLYKNNLSYRVFTSIVRNFDNNEQKLIEAYNISRTNFEISNWLEVFTQTLTQEQLETRENISEFIKEEETSKSQPFLDLNKRQLKVLRYLQTVPSIKREDYCHMMEVSTMTAFRDLNDLVRKKLVKIEGQGRGTKYRLTIN